MSRSAPAPWWMFALLAAAAALVYAGGFSFPLVFDDVPYLSGVLERAHWELRPRALADATFALTAWLAGLQLELLRVENVALHGAVVIALFAFLRRLVGRDAPALAGAAVFALHPVAVYGVAYLTQRSIIMATFFCVLSLSAWLEAVRSGSRAWFAAAVCAYALALLSKEHAIMLPAVALALTVAVQKEGAASGRQVWTALAIEAAIAVAVVCQLHELVGAVYEPRAAVAGEVSVAQATWLASALTQCELFFHYLALWLLPHPRLMSIDLHWALSSSTWPAAFFAAWGLVWAMVLLVGQGGRLIAFALLAPWLLFFTEFSVVRVQEPFVLYRSYLWGMGAAFAVAAFLQLVRARTIAALAVAACLPLAAAAHDRASTFATQLDLWDDAARKIADPRLPLADRTLSNRGAALLLSGRVDEAIADFDRALSINPSNEAAARNGAAARKLQRWNADKEGATDAVR